MLKPIMRLFLGCSFVLSMLLAGSAADKQIADPSRPTGLKPIDAAQVKYIKQNWPRIQRVHLNQIGLARINEVRGKRGKSLIDPKNAKAVGHELESAIAGSGISAQAVTIDAEIFADLPVRIDNSTLPYFPPIRDQGMYNSCAPFATTYTQLSHMSALARASHTLVEYSPKWTYNMLNGGVDGGSYILDNYALLENHGAATWTEFPYDDDFLSWSLVPATWRNALSARTRTMQYGDDVNTENGMAQLKELLNNGYVIVFGTYIMSWQGQLIMDDGTTADDDIEVGKGVGYFVNGQLGSHAMTIVGYNDAIWVDVNGDLVIDAGEKGAFKVANSWGAEWQDAGFVWLSYDALRAVSAVPGGPSEGRQGAVVENKAFVLTARVDYSPSVIAEFTVNHAKRGQMGISLGISETSETLPTLEWYPTALSYKGGYYAFDGSNTAVDGTFVLDFTDLLVETGVERKFYLGIWDNEPVDPVTLKAFKIVDLTTNTNVDCVTTLPIDQDGSSEPDFAYAQYTYAGSAVNRPPTLSDMWVGPQMGTLVDTYYYEVYYEDPDGDSAAIASISIDGIPHDMSEYPLYPGWYHYTTTFAEVGTHDYSFYFTDVRGESIRYPAGGAISGPVVTLTHFVTEPVVPEGEAMPVLGESQTYTTLGSVCYGTGHDIQYRFDWGDSTDSGWLPVGQTSASHAWSSSGSYAVKAQARCVVDPLIISPWSGQLIVTIPARIPFTESFASSGFPQGWVQQNVGADVYNGWILVNSGMAGGQPFEMRCEFEDVVPGTSRLITAPINTQGYSTLRLRFKHFIDPWTEGGAIFKVQTSTDKVIWTDEAWTVTSETSNIGPETVDTTIVNNLNSETTYISFEITGDLYMFDYWYIDDVEITAPGKLRMFVKDTLGYFLWMNTMTTDETFEGWEALTGGTSTTPAVAVFNNHLYIIVKDAFSNVLWYQSRDADGIWSGWSMLGGSSPSTPSMAVFNNKLYVAIQEADNRISCKSMDANGVWGDWAAFPGATSTTPVLASFNGKLHLIVKDLAYNYMWWNSMDETETWSGWQRLTGESPSPVAMTEYNNRLYMFVRGNTNDLYYRSMDTEGAWGPWTMMVGATSVTPAIAAFNGRLYLFVKDANGYYVWTRSMDSTETFGSWTKLPGGTMVPIALTVF